MGRLTSSGASIVASAMHAPLGRMTPFIAELLSTLARGSAAHTAELEFKPEDSRPLAPPSTAILRCIDRLYINWYLSTVHDARHHVGIVRERRPIVSAADTLHLKRMYIFYRPHTYPAPLDVPGAPSGAPPGVAASGAMTMNPGT